jgi:hypothetical protein|tara:strand:+ start:121 stop:276 length:156 start_codon:yes stop_codon:yes gene_type:complete
MGKGRQFKEKKKAIIIEKRRLQKRIQKLMKQGKTVEAGLLYQQYKTREGIK